MTADLVFSNGLVFSAGWEAPRRCDVVVAGGRISTVLGVGEARDDLTGAGRVVDLDGRFLTAGFQDAHVHPGTGGLDMMRCTLVGVRSSEEALKTIADYAALNPGVPWILGGGWSQDHFPRGCPSKAALDAITDRPVFLYNRDGHGAWVNSAALDAAGITASTTDPVDGRIERNPDGTPQGTLHEGAANLVKNFAPEPTEDERLAGMVAGHNYLLSQGITAWQDAHVDEVTHRLYRSLAVSGDLLARVAGAMWWDRNLGIEQIDRFVEMRSHAAGRYQPTAVKLMVDGVVENHTALMLEPYLGGQPNNVGIDFIPDLTRIVVALDAAGFPCHFHAIGDGAVRKALDAIEQAQRVNGLSRNRHSIAHIQVVHPVDIPRFARLGVVANCQPLWASDGGYQTELTKPGLGKVRSEWQYPFGSLLRSGASLAMGSDWDVSTADVMAQIDVAVNRINRIEPGWPPLNEAECLTVNEALTAFTLGSAYVNCLDHLTGTVEAGMAADLVILEDIPFSRQDIHQIQVSETYVAGRAVYSN